MREQKIKSLPLFSNAGETKFITNYLYAVCTPLPSGGVGGGFFIPQVARRADVKSRPYLSAGQ